MHSNLVQRTKRRAGTCDAVWSDSVEARIAALMKQGYSRGLVGGG